MSLENASGGFTDLDELARNNTLVVARIREFLAHEKDSTTGYESDPVMADLLICNGHRAGEVVRGMKIKKNGIVSTLRRSAPGKDVAGMITVKLNQKRKDTSGNPQPFVAMDPVDAGQMDTVKGVYKDGTGFDDNANLVSATAATSGNGGNYTAAGAPPF